jgi:hypothetical protein
MNGTCGTQKGSGENATEKPVLGYYSLRSRFMVFYIGLLPFLFVVLVFYSHAEKKLPPEFMTPGVITLMTAGTILFLAAVFVAVFRMSGPAVVVSEEGVEIKKWFFGSLSVLSWKQIVGLYEERIPVPARYSLENKYVDILKIVFRRFDRVSGKIVIDQATLNKSFITGSDVIFPLLRNRIKRGLSLDSRRRMEQIKKKVFHPFFFNNVEIGVSGITEHSGPDGADRFIPWENVTWFAVDKSAIVQRDSALMTFDYEKDSETGTITVEGGITGETKALAGNILIMIRPDAVDESVFFFLKSLGPSQVYAVLAGFLLIIAVVSAYLLF